MRAASSRVDPGRVVILGGAGFIGAHLARRLADEGRAVTVVDAGVRYVPHGDAAASWRRAALLRDDVEVVRADVRDRARLEAILAERAPLAVVHLANLPLASVAEHDAAGARSAILDATAQPLAAVAALEHRPRLVYVSSSMVYGDFACEPQPEDAPRRPRNRYGELKLAAEEVAARAGLDLVVVRPSAVYGPGDANGRILSRLVDAAREGRAVEVDDPGTRLDFTHVDDLVDGLARTIDAPAVRGQAFNLTRGVARTLAEAAAIAGAELRRAPKSEPRPRRGTLDVSRARRLLGYAPRIDLEVGLGTLAAAAAAA